MRPLGILASLLTRWDLIAKLSPASRLSSLVRPLQKKQYPPPSSVSCPSFAMRRSSASLSRPGQPDPVARQVNTTGGTSGCSGSPHCPCVSQCDLCSPQCDAVSAFEPVELATAGFFRALRRFQSSHARVDKPLFTKCLNDLWLYPHLIWPVRRNRCPGCGRGRMLTTRGDRGQSAYGARPPLAFNFFFW